MPASRPFGYWRDPICLVAAATYACNRLWWKPLWGTTHPFIAGHLNDLLYIPVVLPLFLWLLRALRLRAHDRQPTIAEITILTVWWGLLAEVVGPKLLHHGTADTWDLVAYAIGAALAFVAWRLRDTAVAPADRPQPA